MKIMICGKGGSGKSTVSVMLARALKDRGREVLVVDADESNFGLARLLGLAPPALLMEHFGGKPGVREKLKTASPMNPVPLFSGPVTLGSLPAPCLEKADGISFLAMGKIRDFGEGCACMVGVLTKKLLENLVLDPNQRVVVDTEAGVEHFGRGVESGCDAVVGVLDPTMESAALAAKMAQMAKKAGIPVGFVLNKTSPAAKKVMEKHLEGIGIIACIPQIDSLFEASLEGIAIKEYPPAVDELCQWLENTGRKKP